MLNAVNKSPGRWIRAFYFLALFGSVYAAETNCTIPRKLIDEGLIFAGERVPVERPEVRARIENQIEYLVLDRHAKISQWLQEGVATFPLIDTILDNRQVPRDLRYVCLIESGVNARAVSGARATGWWQFMRHTARDKTGRRAGKDWSMDIDWWGDDRRDLFQSTSAAAHYLSFLYHNYTMDGEEIEALFPVDGFRNWALVCASYNGGPARVKYRCVKFNTASFWDLVLPLETEEYVPRIIAVKLLFEHPEYFGLNIDPAHNIRLSVINDISLSKNLSIPVLATWCGISPRQVWLYNSRLDPSENYFPARQFKNQKGGHLVHRILVPKDAEQKVRTKLVEEGYLVNANDRAPLEQEKRHSEKLTWKWYKVETGDGWLSIAEKTNTSVSELKGWNPKTARRGIWEGQKIRYLSR